MAQEIAEELCEGYHQEQEGKLKSIATYQARILIEQSNVLARRARVGSHGSNCKVICAARRDRGPFIVVRKMMWLWDLRELENF